MVYNYRRYYNTKNIYKYLFYLIIMSYKLIDAAQARPGTAIMIDGTPTIVRTNDISKTGKHGHAKCRIEAISIIDVKKKVIAVSGHERFEVPLISKSRAQVLSASDDKASVMDLESFETFDLLVPEELNGQLNPEDQVEYWEVDGTKIIKRKA